MSDVTHVLWEARVTGCPAAPGILGLWHRPRALGLPSLADSTVLGNFLSKSHFLLTSRRRDDAACPVWGQQHVRGRSGFLMGPPCTRPRGQTVLNQLSGASRIWPVLWDPLGVSLGAAGTGPCPQPGVLPSVCPRSCPCRVVAHGLRKPHVWGAGPPGGRPAGAWACRPSAPGLRASLTRLRLAQEKAWWGLPSVQRPAQGSRHARSYPESRPCFLGGDLEHREPTELPRSCPGI